MCGSRSQSKASLVTVLLVFTGGRVIPFCTERWPADNHPRQWPALNWCATLATLLVVPMYLLAGRDPLLVKPRPA